MLDYLRTYLQAKLPLTDEQFAALARLLLPRELPRQQVLVQQGEVSRYGAFVVQGCLRSFVVDKKGKEHVLQFAPENWWISDQHGLIHHEPALFSIDAVEDSRVLLFGPDFYEQLPQLGPGLQTLFYDLQKNSMKAMQKRLIATLSATAEERYLDFIRTYPSLTRRLPQRLIAAYLGITPESLSRIRKELARA
ncbi:Crp/Fnr family transcriptional regulator [Hymenobacter cellulosilyticus]|uniref:Crp/Fnr family transcriptional regulator n=1 Tax=Hymenobacter cellulosilyticus TaxID=2932248 RepID=A0A8T9Q5V6_9BACT|nr:Crp/Fnr family transcriptional regulator [Hymenobacter cellulosilyticus]UOQ71358.1 Crp/Fnr family transcriptional regulator [Hymenobacter cellulosilyticus]